MLTGNAPFVISFSGIDGAGKSTQISSLISFLHDAGLRTRVLTFWDDVVVLSRCRELASHKAFGGEMGIGSPDKPVNRRDKNVTAWPVTLFRFFVYAADSLSLRRVTGKQVLSDADVIIFDRYIYDELANLPLQSKLASLYVKALAWLLPKPGAAFLIDADPVQARERKPEYPLDFLHKNREAYLRLHDLLGCFEIVEASSIEAAHDRIRQTVVDRLSPYPAAGPQIAALD